MESLSPRPLSPRPMRRARHPVQDATASRHQVCPSPTLGVEPQDHVFLATKPGSRIRGHPGAGPTGAQFRLPQLQACHAPAPGGAAHGHHPVPHPGRLPGAAPERPHRGDDAHLLHAHQAHHLLPGPGGVGAPGGHPQGAGAPAASRPGGAHLERRVRHGRGGLLHRHRRRRGARRGQPGRGAQGVRHRCGRGRHRPWPPGGLRPPSTGGREPRAHGALVRAPGRAVRGAQGIAALGRLRGQQPGVRRARVAHRSAAVPQCLHLHGRGVAEAGARALPLLPAPRGRAGAGPLRAHPLRRPALRARGPLATHLRQEPSPGRSPHAP